MDRLLRLGGASFASTMILVLLGALHQELGEVASTTDPAGVAEEVREAVTMSLLDPPRRVAVADAAVADAAVAGAPAAAPALRGLPDSYVAIDLDAGPPPWAPPTWFPEGAQGDLWILDGVGDGLGAGGGDLGPDLRLHSRAVFVYDVEAGEVLLSRGADNLRPVASLTKVVAGLALASERPDLEREVCLDWAMRPSWPGARTKLRTDTCTTGWDLLGAALVKSDNGAAYALAEVAGLPHEVFVDRMNAVSADLGMSMSSFSDPSGVEDDNLSTARDMTRAVLAASRHPELQPAASAPFWDLHDRTHDRTRRLTTTNRLHERRATEILAAKTGYTDTARHCFTGVFRTRDGREVAITTLGARWSRQRWSDLRALLHWVETRGR